MLKILVIDDEKTILENIKFVLGILEYEVLTASSGEEGLEIFKNHFNEIDVVITDMKLPRMSGLDILDEIKKVFPEMSVIILTGHGDMENAILAMKKGAFEYLKKPVNVDDLTIAINKAVNRKRLLEDSKKIQDELLEKNLYLQGLLDSSQKILLNMLPKSMPEIPGFRFSAEYRSSDAVGGDMYDIGDIGEYICFYIFDVSSHGILASVITIILKSFLRNIEYNYRQGINKRRFPEIVVDVNLELCANTAQNVFATLLLGFIDKKTQTLYYVSAGHIHQYIFNQNKMTPMTSTGTILGAFEEASYSCNVVQLEPGDKIVLFTDGVIEASYNGTVFGNDKLVSILESNNNNPIEQITQNIFKEVSEYAHEDFQDDITIVGIEVTGE